MQLNLHVSYGLPRSALPAAASFRAWVKATLLAAQHAHKKNELSIRLVDEAEGRALNHRYRGKNTATNVLSFPADLPSSMKLPLLGDLVICAPVVAAEAIAQGKPLKHHYAHLTVHGVLHLIGFDHQKPRETARMEALECKILSLFDIKNPY